MMNGPVEILYSGHFLCRGVDVVLAGRPVHGPSAEQVQMQVVDGLASVIVGIDNDTITAIQLLAAGEVRGSHHQMAE